MSELGKGELDIETFWSIFWANKILVVLFILVSFLFSLYKIQNTTIKYKAEVVLGVKDLQNTNTTSYSSDSLGLDLMPINSLLLKKKETGLLPRIIGREFLMEVIDEHKLISMLNFDLTPNSPSFFTLKGMLIKSGFYKQKVPTNEQMKENFIKYIRSLIDVQEYKYNNISTSAHSIFVTHDDPNFAAFLANELAIKFYETQRSEMRSQYSTAVNFLSERLKIAQSEQNEAKLELESFLLGNPSNFKPNSNVNDLLSYTTVALTDISEVAKLKTNRSELINSRKSIEALNLSDVNNLQEFQRFLTVAKGISNEFVISIRKLFSDKENYSVALLSEKFDRIKDREVKKLSSVSEDLAQLIAKKEKLALDSMRIGQNLNKLRLNYFAKNSRLEAVKMSYENKILEEGAANAINENIYTKATPPTEPFSPNIRYIIFLNLALSLLIGAFVIVLRQISRRVVYHKSQIENILESKSVLNFKSAGLIPKSLNVFHKNDIKNGITLEFLTSLKDKGRLGCLIPINKKPFLRGYAKSYHLFEIIKCFFDNETKGALITNGHVFESEFQPKISMGNKDAVLKNNLENSSVSQIDLIDNADQDITACDFAVLDRKLEEYSEALFFLNYSLSEVVKFKFIEKCDYFVLIGNKGLFCADDVEKYKFFGKAHEKKLKHFILVQ